MTLTDPASIAALLGAALAAGFVDAVIGGGGLILIPALLLTFPTLPPATALGTNKVAALAGTGAAAVLYARKVPLPRVPVTVGAMIALACAAAGAAFAATLPPTVFRPFIIVALLAVGTYVAVRRGFGTQHTETRMGAGPLALAGLAVALIASYDGLFGPGTGIFLIVALTSILGGDFLRSAAAAKALNAATNVGALIMFATSGHVLWALGFLAAVANVGGAALGSRLVLTRGTALIRVALLVIVCVLTAKLAFDQFA
ncbi:MAG: TSUP family transporter [Bowdeniella nasicola]|nr:TSUP family transporter [Bowdeniella nasicola]